jgi:hypothetical protein
MEGCRNYTEEGLVEDILKQANMHINIKGSFKLLLCHSSINQALVLSERLRTKLGLPEENFVFYSLLNPSEKVLMDDLNKKKLIVICYPFDKIPKYERDYTVNLESMLKQIGDGNPNLAFNYNPHQ